MPFAHVGETDIHYVVAGSGPPLVFLHGFGSCAEAWYQQIESFSTRFQVFSYDSVNHGHSSNSPADQPEPDRADELEGFLGALGIERPILAGNSMGALTILRWAVRHPEEATALVPSGMGITPPGGEADAAARRRRMTAAVDGDTLFLPSQAGFTAGFPAERSEQYQRYVRLRSTATRIEATRHPRQARAVNPTREELADRVGGIRSPMRIVVGDLDWLCDAAAHLHRLVPHSELSVLAGAPHNAYFECPEAYNGVVRSFLETVLDG